MTISISARCGETGMLGAAIASSSICVSSRCIWAEAGVGVVATQNVTDPCLGIDGLIHMKKGLNATSALKTLTEQAEHISWRQLALVDHDGKTAYFGGGNMLGLNNVAEGTDCIAAGNLLSSEEVPSIMVNSFLKTQGRIIHLAQRLLATLETGRDAGGEAGPMHSAGLLVMDTQPWPLVDLRVDWKDEDPIGGLRALWESYKNEMDDYVLRALNPDSAPSYGVPGNP